MIPQEEREELRQHADELLESAENLNTSDRSREECARLGGALDKALDALDAAEARLAALEAPADANDERQLLAAYRRRRAMGMFAPRDITDEYLSEMWREVQAQHVARERKP